MAFISDVLVTLQDVFLMIRRKKVTIFTDAKDTTTVLELKKMIEGKCHCLYALNTAVQECSFICAGISTISVMLTLFMIGNLSIP
jgi:hypothetical protein